MSMINAPLNRRLRMGLVGGGGTGFIGPVHRLAAGMDGRAELVAAALSSDPTRGRSAALDLGISEERAYGSYAEMIEQESRRDAESRIDFISIATPNHTHFAIAKQALDAGFHVVCDKPMTISVDHAEQLASLVDASRRVFAVTHNYTGYPLIRQARDMIAAGELGEILAVRTHYIQGWLQGLVPGQTPSRGAWKSDATKAGSGALGDIATHAYQLARYVTGLMPDQVSCRLRNWHPDRDVDDYGHALVRYQNEALGMVTFSQITHGRLNDLSIEIDGSRASLSWRQESPNQLVVHSLGRPTQIYDRHPQAEYTTELARASCRLPAGHPEAFLEAFANVYNACFDDIVACAAGDPYGGQQTIYPNVGDGVEGVWFVAQCQSSAAEQGAWKTLRHPRLPGASTHG